MKEHKITKRKKILDTGTQNNCKNNSNPVYLLDPNHFNVSINVGSDRPSPLLFIFGESTRNLQQLQSRGVGRGDGLEAVENRQSSVALPYLNKREGKLPLGQPDPTTPTED